MIRRARLFSYIFACLPLLVFARSSQGDALPDYWNGLIATQSATPEASATANVLV
jgi:hypothetical protein